MALFGRRAIVLLVWTVVSCLAVHNSQDAGTMDLDMDTQMVTGRTAGLAAVFAKGPKGEPIKSRTSGNKCLQAVKRTGKEGDVGDKCTKDSQCKNRACDTGNVYKCKNKCVVDHRDKKKNAAFNCGKSKSAMTTVISKCDAKKSSQRWKYDRMKGGTLRTSDGYCLTRKKGQSHVTLDRCVKGSKDQQWKRLCGAWANGDGKSGRVLELASGTAVRGAQWTGAENQLWHFKEVVAHSKCSKKRYKIMKFNGSPDTAAHVKVFLSFPSKLITAMMWIKGNEGTPLSYATKNHVKAFVLKNIKSLEVWIKDKKIHTKVDCTSRNNKNTWVHLAVTWVSETGELKVYKNGQKVFAAKNVMSGKDLTPGGCLVMGQEQQKLCGGLTNSFVGEMTELQVWRSNLGIYDIHRLSVSPVSKAVIKKLGKFDAPKTPQNLRLAFLTRQYSFEELKISTPPVCEMDQFKKKKAKKIPHVAGNMPRLSGTGDVHYMNFHHCRFDDQSVGEWVVAQTQPKWWKSAPMMLQYRTSPSRTNCPWCQNGAVSYIDGCAMKYKDDHASAGFGGYGFGGSYTPYAAMNGQKLSGKRRTREMEVVAHNHYFKAIILAEGVIMECRRQAIFITMPNKFKGKIQGLGGTGEGPSKDWMMGPNKDAYPQTKPGKQMPGLAGACHRRWQYTIRNSPFNGNHASKPLVKWFKSWQVDGNHIPSVFTYQPNTNQGPGSFNRLAGQNIKPVSNSNSKPKGAKAEAMKECRALRSTPKARLKCVFDFMMLGADAIKASRKDRMAQRESKVKKPTKRSIRDITQFRNDAEWNNHVSFACAGKFRRFQMRKRRAVVRAAKERAKRAKEKAAKALFKAQTAGAEKNGPCPSGFKTAWHPNVYKNQVPAALKECPIGMVALDAKAKVTHVRSQRKSLSVISKIWMNGHDSNEELGESRDSKVEIGSRCTKSSQCKHACDHKGRYKCKGKCLSEKPDKNRDQAHNCPDLQAAHLYTADKVGAQICSAGTLALSLQECKVFAASRMGPADTSPKFQVLTVKGPTGCIAMVKGKSNGAVIFNSAKKAESNDSTAPVCKPKPKKSSQKLKPETKLEKMMSQGQESKEPEKAQRAFLSAGAEVLISGSTQPEEEVELGDAQDETPVPKSEKSGAMKAVVSLLSLGEGAAPKASIVEGWGSAKDGADVSQVKNKLKDVVALASTQLSFAALMKEGNRPQVLAWGQPAYGGSTTGVDKQLYNIDSIYATCCSFAALRKGGAVITWGNKATGGDSKPAARFLRKDVQTITGTQRAFAASTVQGKLVAWGDVKYGGDARKAQKALEGSTGVKSISATSYAFAVLTKSRRRSAVFAWGNPKYGGKQSKSVQTKLANPKLNVKQVFGNKYAFAALTDEGNVITWGSSANGGNSNSVQRHLKKVQTITASNRAFAALTADGKVITWGHGSRGANSRQAHHYIKKGISSIYGNRGAFVAKSADGTTFNWGGHNFGGKWKRISGAADVAGDSNSFSIIQKNGNVARLTRPPPPPSGGRCHYSWGSICTDTGLTGCGHPMADLSRAHGRWPHQWHPLFNVYIYMNRWVGGCGARWHHWCLAGNSQSNQYALCANGPGQNGRNGHYIMTYKGWRYYKVRVAGRMTEHNIDRTCRMHGFSTPCPGSGGRPYNRNKAQNSKIAAIKGLKVVYANAKAFVGLREPVSSLCQRRSGPDGRTDARCGDGWELESKGAGKAVCEDDNPNKELPCSMLTDSCTDLAVQAKCAKTCGTYDKGSEECKQVGQIKDKYKCSRSYSCTPKFKFKVPDGLTWLKTKTKPASVGCGSSVSIKVAQCTDDKTKVKCSCPSAYALATKSITLNDCGTKEYQQEGSKVLATLNSMAKKTEQWLITCSGMPESSNPYITKPVIPENLKMKKGKITVWELDGLHSQSMTKSGDGCKYDFTMSMSVCATAPFREMILQIPSVGSQFKKIGCGCQEILVRANYEAKIVGMENMMQSTQDVCASNFAKWTRHFQEEYFFGGLNYQSHAIRLAKEMKKQCKGSGSVIAPEKAMLHRKKSLAKVMAANSKAIRKYEAEVHANEQKLLELQKQTTQCKAGLPSKSEFSKSGYRKLVDKFSLEPEKPIASTLSSEALSLKARLNAQDHKNARLKVAQDKASP